jgi:hypothetical protein
MSFVRAVNAPTVTAESCLAMLASRAGSVRASLCSFGVILYLLSYFAERRVLAQLADARGQLADARVDLPDDRGNGDEAEEEDRPEQCEVSREDRDHPRDAPASEEFNERPEPERDEHRQKDQLQHGADQVQQIQRSRGPRDGQRDPHDPAG